MTCESLALTAGEGWAAHDVSANDGLSFPGGARAGERQAGLHCIETVPLPPMYRRHLRRHRQRDREEAESQEEVQGLLHEFGYSSMSLLDQLVMTMPLTRPTQEARAMVPDAPPEGGRTTTTMTRLLPLLYLPRELPEGFRQAMEWEERLSEEGRLNS